MYLDDVIAQLQVIRAQYGDIEVWVEAGLPPMSVSVKNMYSPRPKPSETPKKVVWIE
jgi:hypothetical protein